MKYKIIPDDIVKNLIEFIDEIQFEAASGNKPDDLHRINFCNWMISELMNGLDGFDSEEEAEDDNKDSDVQDRWDTIDNYKKQFGMEFPENMSEKEWKKLIKQFDSFIDGWDRAYKKSNYKDKAKQNELKKFLQELKIDHELTPEEKFELYYDEYRRRKKEDESKSLKQVLRSIGLKKPPKK
tara:strand:+ start:275 stop:820 length:546 start_codon:yes stop_codon:yes gene_type:complete